MIFRAAILFIACFVLPAHAGGNGNGSANRKCHGLIRAVVVGNSLHYQAHFSLRPNKNVEITKVWNAAVRLIHDWIGKKHPDMVLPPSAFNPYMMEEALRMSDGASVRVASFQGKGTVQVPELWALRYEHPDHEVMGRRWRTDVGLTMTGGEVLVNVRNEYWFDADHVGFEPEVPFRSTPRVVSLLLGPNMLFRAETGVDIPISSRPIAFKVGDGMKLLAYLEDAKRNLPIVYLSRTRNGDILTEPNVLADQLAGSAIVAYEDEADLPYELKEVIPERFRAWNGAVRIYHGSIKLPFSRHPFLRYDDLIGQESPSEKALSYIAQNILRSHELRNRDKGGPGIQSVEDISTRRLREGASQRSEELARLRAQLTALEGRGGDDSEKFEQTLREYEQLIQLQDEEQAKLASEAGRLKTDVEDLKGRVDQTTAENKNLQENLQLLLEEIAAEKRKNAHANGSANGHGSANGAATNGKPKGNQLKTISSFADPGLETFFREHASSEGKAIKGASVFPWARYASQVLRNLELVNDSSGLNDIKAKAGELKHYAPTNRHYGGYYGIKIDLQYRVLFRWDDKALKAVDVTIDDFHNDD